MFYSHEVLTNRKYGVATVWLVATLGSKSSLKRITRKQMLDVDVAKACKTIVDPAAPMALRLQGNLLYGVSRVYLQQCGYVLADAQNAHNTMMLMLRSVENHALDPDAGKARPEQLVLQDDPSFLPNFAFLPSDILADLDLGSSTALDRSGESQSLTPFGSQPSSQSSHVGGYGLVLPSSSPDRPAGFGLEGGNADQGDNHMLDIDDLLNLEEPEFIFGEDGDMIEFTSGQRAPETPAPAQGTGGRVQSDAGASSRVRREHEEGLQGGVQVRAGDEMDMHLPVYGDDVPDIEAASSSVDQRSEQSEVIESVSSTAAPMRRKKKAAKTLPKDRKLELSNADLLGWNSNYLDNMQLAARPKVAQYSRHQAKKNAEHYVWGAGLGGLGRDHFAAQGPLAAFIGDRLFELFTGTSKNRTDPSKRDRDSGIDEGTQEGRRKRQKAVSRGEETNRGQDSEAFQLDGDDQVELPRDAASALDDEQILSAMPWNMSASKRGSSALPPSGRVTMMSEHARPGSRAGSRMVSASPLLRRSTGRFEALQSLDSDGGGDEIGYAAATCDAAVLEEALSGEGENFLAFAAEGMAKRAKRAKRGEATQVGDQGGAEVTFEQLLPPRETSRMIAAQGFVMVLALGTRGLLCVRQVDAFGDMTLRLGGGKDD